MIEIKRKSKTLSEAQNEPQEREEVRAGIPPPQPPTGQNRRITGPNRGIVWGESPPDMREVWREVFRMYTKYAPAIRAAAALPEGYEEAGAIFLEALERVRWVASAGEDGAIIALRAYDMLDDVWQRARKKVDNG